MSSRVSIFLGCLVLVAASVFGINYVNLQRPLTALIDSDKRNGGISIRAHYDNYWPSKTLVFDIRDIDGEKSPLDVFRLFLQFAEVKKDSSFDTVKLSFRGTTKFILKGNYFNTLGVEYKSQNPAYTIRTFPEKLYKPDGRQAFGTWSGGILGVLSRQMEDFSEFHKQWYLEELSAK